MSESFTDLIRRIRQGDSEAASSLFQRNQGGLRAYVRLKSGDMIRARESCSDLVQSVFREVLKDVGGFQGEDEATFRHWLYKVALHKITDRLDYYHAARRDARLEVGSDDVSDRALLSSYDWIRSPSRVATTREEIERIERAFDRLPDDYRNIIIEIRFLGRTAAEVGSDTGRSEEAVRQVLSRARARLALLMEADRSN